MIRTIRGELSLKTPDCVVVDVGGVGFRLFVPLSTFAALDDVGRPVRLLVHTHVREDALDLYGFASEPEREMFELLISVSRIGPRLARNILSGIEAAQLRELLAREDKARLSTIPGVGIKTAERMILELRDKLPKVASAVVDLDEDALSALVNLGYKRKDAEQALLKVRESLPEPGGLEQLLRRALKLLSKA